VRLTKAHEGVAWPKHMSMLQVPFLFKTTQSRTCPRPLPQHTCGLSRFKFRRHTEFEHEDSRARHEVVASTKLN
jgi:hypothetical protein